MTQHIKKVDFVVAGAQKSGTTALDLYLRDHPDVHMPLAGRKELHYFDMEENYQKGDDFYHHNFDYHRRNLTWGEVTPIYMYWSSVPARIKLYNPRMKFILVLRNPIERAFSHWNMEYARGLEDLTFSAAIEREVDNKSRHGDEYQHRVRSYIDRGYYSIQIKRLWSYFSSRQVLIVKHSDLKNHPEETMNSIYAFLGLSGVELAETRRAHVGGYGDHIEDDVKRVLHKSYEQEIMRLEIMLGWDCREWLE